MAAKSTWIAFVCLGVLASCERSDRDAPITVSAAISLKQALADVALEFAKRRPGAPVVFNFGASGALQQQIEHGAPVDVFVSASQKQMRILERANLIDTATRVNLLGNRLVLITPEGRGRLVTSFGDLARKDIRRIAIGEPKSVPVGQYTEEALASMGILDSIRTKLVFAKDARQVLTYVASGDAEAGIVYQTDVTAFPGVSVIERIDERLHSPIVYVAAVVSGSKRVESAAAFLDFLRSEESREILQRHGFVFLPEEEQ